MLSLIHIYLSGLNSDMEPNATISPSGIANTSVLRNITQFSPKPLVSELNKMCIRDRKESIGISVPNEKDQAKKLSELTESLIQKISALDAVAAAVPSGLSAVRCV